METEQDRQKHVAWSRLHHASLCIGGVWSVPRSGLIFTKTEAGFDLKMVMPFMPEMAQAAEAGKDVPATAEALRAYQMDDFATIQRHNEAAGLEVTDSKALLIDRHITEDDLQATVTKVVKIRKDQRDAGIDIDTKGK